MHLKSAIILTAVALLASRAHAGAVPSESIDTLASYSNIIVVGQIVKIEIVPNSQQKLQTASIVHQHATIKVLRGIQSADAKPFSFDTVVVDYLDYDPEVGISLVNGPYLPTLSLSGLFGQSGFNPFRVGNVAAFPLKRNVLGAQSPLPADATVKIWHLVDEEGVNLVLPAIAKPLDGAAPTSARDFLHRELAGALAFGDFAAIDKATDYLAPSFRPVKPETLQSIVALMEPQMHDEARWIDIAVAAYCRLGMQHPTVAQLRAGTAKKESSSPLLDLALAKVNPENLDERLLRAFVAHQDQLPNVGPLLLENYGNNPLLLDLERTALADAKPGAINTAYQLATNTPALPLIQAALADARKAITPPSAEDPSQYFATVRLLMRFGSDDDFAFFVEQIKLAQKNNPSAFEAYLSNASEGTDSRRIQIYRLYIDATTPLSHADSHDLRLCDQAGGYIQAINKQDFTLHLKDPIATRDQALVRIRDWLKSH